jgi:hypothetical protein
MNSKSAAVPLWRLTATGIIYVSGFEILRLESLICCASVMATTANSRFDQLILVRLLPVPHEAGQHVQLLQCCDNSIDVFCIRLQTSGF